MDYSTIRSESYTIAYSPYRENLLFREIADAVQQEVSVFKSDKRKLQHYFSRQLLNKVLDAPTGLVYDAYGKPFLKNSDWHISISHSADIAAVILNKKEPTGIDVERIHPKIKKIKNRFLSDAELAILKEDNETEQLYVMWGAKESLYKLFGRRNLIFKDNLCVTPFLYNSHGGDIFGSIVLSGYEKNYHLKYFKIDDNMMVYVEKEIASE